MARGTARAGSDIDVLVDLDPQKGTLRDLCDISDALEVAFGRRVDLVPSDSLDKYIGPEILRTVKYVKID
jgi:predicted nucleotidyltransferase